MKYSIISSKRQLTLSKVDLEYLKIGPRDKVTIEHEKGALIVKRMTRSISDEIGGVFRDVIPESRFAKPIEEITKETYKRRKNK